MKTLDQQKQEFKEEYCPRIEATTNFGVSTHHAQGFDEALNSLIETAKEEQRKECAKIYTQAQPPLEVRITVHDAILMRYGY